MNRVAITGLGAVCGLGHDVTTIWQNALAGKSGISEFNRLPREESSPIKIAGEAKDFQLSPDILSPREAARYDRFLHFALSAGAEAMTDAGLRGEAGDEAGPYERTRMGAILGVGLGGFEGIEREYRTLQEKGERRVSPFFIPAIVPNMASGLLSLKFSLRGVNYTVSSACASSGHALAQAFEEIRHGRHDVIISGGAEGALSMLPFSSFNNMKALSRRVDDPQGASRPFDRDRDGFVMGEGAGVLILENAEKAQERGAKIYAELVSYGASSDAHHITAPHPLGVGAIACIKQALSRGNVPLSKVDYVNAHGTSTLLGDRVETRALKEVFGRSAQRLAISSTKSMTGHLLGAAGGLESIFCVKAIATGNIPPTINLQNQDPECDLNYVPNASITRDVQYALNNSFGFGGTNASIIFKQV